MKFIHQRIMAESANGIAIDLGFLYNLSARNLNIGVTLQNIGTKMKFVDESYPLPLNFKIGIAHLMLNDALTISMDVNVPVDNITNLHVGGEYSYELYGIKLMPRLGYETDRISDLGPLSGLSVGLGLQWRVVGLDYAWVPYGVLGNSHRISLIGKI